jgi:hypothetical protein
VDGEGSDLILDLVHPLRDFLGSIEHNLPDAPPVDERADRHAELSRELCDAIVERGVLLRPAPVYGGVGLVLIDPSVGDEIDAAQKAKSDATVALTAFDRDHRDDLAEERRAARTAAYQQAIDAGDPARAGELLRATEEADLRTEQEKTADALTSGAYEGWDADGEGDVRRSGSLTESGALTTADLSG